MTFLEAIYTSYFTGYMGILLYWLPVVMCVGYFTLLNVAEYRKDLADRAKSRAPLKDGEYAWERIYHPTLTMGHIVGRYVLSFIPLVNASQTVFVVLPRWTSSFFTMMGKLLDIPLVPKD